MTDRQKQAIVSYVRRLDPAGDVIREISPEDSTIHYNPSAVHCHRAISVLNDEEYIRAFLLVRLVKELGYPSGPEFIELERRYSIGRPSRKGARVDIILRYPADWSSVEDAGRAFLFIECKAPEKFDSDREYLKGQIFDLARQERPQPRYGVYYTARLEGNDCLDEAVIIDLDAYSSHEEWDTDGQPSQDLIPVRYGQPRRIAFANVDEATEALRPLRTDVAAAEFRRLQEELHDIVWGGGGTNNNDVFVMLVRLFLARVYDELETPPDTEYRFQRLEVAGGIPESPDQVVERMSALFLDAARDYLGYAESELAETMPFERRKISAAKVAYVVEQLQSLSLTRNDASRDVDVLGDFFEGIVAQDFTQSKGQFFTPVNLVRFCLGLANVGEGAAEIFLSSRDSQGRPTLPYIIDPSAGSGTFLIESMKVITNALRELDPSTFNKRQREFSRIWFGEESPHYWARDHIYGIEPNADLGLAVKVNMILHGDGSTNTFVRSGLLPFSEYARGGRSHALGVTKGGSHPYPKERNEEFDFLFTNPPFSLDLSAEEKRQLRRDFEIGDAYGSEAVFVERWYQLVREGGRVAAILPESILDTSSTKRLRIFLLQHFKILAAVALPYVAFKPFTSTKTSVVMLQKRTAAETSTWRSTWKRAEDQHTRAVKDLSLKSEGRRQRAVATLLREPIGNVADLTAVQQDALEWARANPDSWILREVLNTAGDEEVFLAEPDHVGYKRRKGLSDLPQPNQLFGGPDTVLESYRRGPNGSEDETLGFWISLRDVVSIPHLRLDPKYHRLWTLRKGRVFKDYSGPLVRLGDLIEPGGRAKVSKGLLTEPRLLIDLENVESRTSRLLNPTEVEEVGSDRIEFGDADIAFAKLEPYLGKIIANRPDERWIGSPEWLLYNINKEEVDVGFIRFMLLLPEMLEAYRCLQSGKRHARLSEDDFLNLLVPRFPYEVRRKLAKVAAVKEVAAEDYRAKAMATRDEIDQAFVAEIEGADEES